MTEKIEITARWIEESDTSIEGGVAPANFAELLALHDLLDSGGYVIAILRQLLAHLRQQRAIRDLHAAAQRITEQLAAKLPQKRVAALGQQVVAQAVDP